MDDKKQCIVCERWGARAEMEKMHMDEYCIACDEGDLVHEYHWVCNRHGYSFAEERDFTSRLRHDIARGNGDLTSSDEEN